MSHYSVYTDTECLNQEHLTYEEALAAAERYIAQGHEIEIRDDLTGEPAIGPAAITTTSR